MYDIRNVGYKYMMAEECRNNGDIENAVKHYESAINNYEYCDNEYILSPSSPYSIIDFCKITTFPGINEMVDKSHKMLYKLKRHK